MGLECPLERVSENSRCRQQSYIEFVSNAFVDVSYDGHVHHTDLRDCGSNIEQSGTIDIRVAILPRVVCRIHQTQDKFLITHAIRTVSVTLA